MAKKILIVDDKEFIRQAIKICLQIEPYEFYEAGDGVEALNLARTVNPDLIILDIMMPGMTGYRVCKELKNNPETKNIIIVFITARGEASVEATVKTSGGDDLIPKPFDPKELRNKVKKLLGS
jgi:DNA-binding response OmpR family regulator